VSISLPPRPPDLDDPAPADKEALIKEARRRTRRRRLRNLAGVLSAVLGALWLYSLLGGSGPQSSSALTGSSPQVISPLPTRANGRIAFLAVRWTADAWYRIDTIKPDGSGQRTLTRCTGPRSSCAYGAFAWSPDGTRFAFERGLHVCCAPKGERPNVHLYVIKADGSAEKQIPGCGPPWPSCDAFAWSPDSKRIAFARSGSLFVVNTLSGRLVRLTHSHSEGGPLWSPRGSTILFATPGGIYRVNADGTGLAKLADGANPSWSPDGKQVAFETGNSISTMDADGSNVTQLFVAGNGPKGTSPELPAWSPDGTQIAFEKTPDTTPDTPGGFAAEIWTMQADGSQPRLLYRSGVGIAGPAVPVWSPDGKLIAFGDPAMSGNGGLFLIDASGEPRVRLLTAAADTFAWQSLSRPSR
jgi:Tol biopolymer transport system component